MLEVLAGADPRGQRPDRRPGRRRRSPGRDGHDGHRRRCSTAPSSAWPTSATAGPTCCATAGCERLTHDHSWVQSLVDEGKISEAEAAVHPHRSLLLKVLNGQPANDPDLPLVAVQAGRPADVLQRRALRAGRRPRDRRARWPCPTWTRRWSGWSRGAGRGRHRQHHRDRRRRGRAAPAGGTAGEAGRARRRRRTRHPAAARRTEPRVDRVDDDEDTVVTDPVPPASRAARPPRARSRSEDEARYNPQPPRPAPASSGRWSRLLVLCWSSAPGWARRTRGPGPSTTSAPPATQVAIFQGLSESMPGLPLSRSTRSRSSTVADAAALLPGARSARNIDVSSLDVGPGDRRRADARPAKRCATRTPTAASPRPRPTPDLQPSPAPADHVDVPRRRPRPPPRRSRAADHERCGPPSPSSRASGAGSSWCCSSSPWCSRSGAYAHGRPQRHRRRSSPASSLSGRRSASLLALLAHLAVRWRLPVRRPGDAALRGAAERARAWR